MTVTSLIIRDQGGNEIARASFGLNDRHAPGDVAIPLSFSALIPRARLTTPGFAVLDLPTRQLPVQTETLTRWSDGSVQWLRLDTGPCAIDELPQQLCIRLLRDLQAVAATHVIRLDKGDGGARLDTGTARFDLDPTSATTLRNISLADGPVLCPGAILDLSIVDAAGRALSVGPTDFRVETSGPVRATVCAASRVGAGVLNLSCRTSFHAGTGLVKLEITLHNPAAARRAGGVWDLGDPGSVRLRNFSLELILKETAGAGIHWTVDGNATLDGRAAESFALHQESSGGENWNSPNHVNAAGIVPFAFRGYRLSVDGVHYTGQRASPTLVWRTDRGLIGLHVPEFWQQFPKVISVHGQSLRIGLLPAEHGDTFELQGGERKTHVLWLKFDRPSADIESIAAQMRTAAARLPALRPLLDDMGRAPDSTLVVCDKHQKLDALLDEALSGPRGFIANREAVDEYGWRHFGEIVADHEQAYYTEPPPLISHYNNQFDVTYGLLLNYLRTGNPQLFELGDALARHVVDIDIYHTMEDRSAYSGGMFWHTDHYRTAHTATHRAYSIRNRPGGADYGGGPSCEHNYTTGLYLHYCLTGDHASRDAVVSLANWVMRMDNGQLTPWRFLDSSPTGGASATREESFHGPGRGAGNSINALLDAWRLTAEPRYLDYAETLIRRCIHPRDDIDALDLLDFEPRWSYTVFLSALLKYLQLKVRSGLCDPMFHYGRESLLHYARWMTDNEIPYFDRADEMEFPTETWAAQEMRKANVLRLAGAWVDDPWKSRMFAKGTELAQRAWQDLHRFETRSCARPLAILMVEALKELDAAPATIAVPTDPSIDGFGPRLPFVTQKQRIKAMLRSPSAALQGIAHLISYPFRQKKTEGY